MFPTMTFSSFYTLFIIMVAFVILSGKEKKIYPFHNHGLRCRLYIMKNFKDLQIYSRSKFWLFNKKFFCSSTFLITLIAVRRFTTFDRIEKLFFEEIQITLNDPSEKWGQKRGCFQELVINFKLNQAKN